MIVQTIAWLEEQNKRLRELALKVAGKVEPTAEENRNLELSIEMAAHGKSCFHSALDQLCAVI